MRLSLVKILFTIIIATIILFTIVYFVPVTALRAIFGIPFVLFFPGFVLLSSVIPGSNDLSTTARIVLSFVISIIVDSCIALILNYSSFGITFNSVVTSLTIFVLVAAFIGMVRQLRLPAIKQTFLEFNLQFATPVTGTLNFTLIAVMVLVIISMLGVVTYFSFAPKSEKTFTQFYIVNQDGSLYSPADATAGDDISIIVGVRNNERNHVNYRIQALVNSRDYREFKSISLMNGQEWKESITIPTETNLRTEVEFLLFKNNEDTPYLESLRVWIDPSGINIVSN